MDHIPQERLLKEAAVLDRTSISRAGLWAKVKAAEFPRPVRIGSNRIAWPESAVAAWIAAKIG